MRADRFAEAFAAIRAYGAKPMRPGPNPSTLERRARTAAEHAEAVEMQRWLFWGGNPEVEKARAIAQARARYERGEA